MSSVRKSFLGIGAVAFSAVLFAACSSGSSSSTPTTSSSSGGGATTTSMKSTSTTAASGLIDASYCPNQVAMSATTKSIQDGGTQVSYTVGGTYQQAASLCEAGLKSAGWTVQGGGGGGSGSQGGEGFGATKGSAEAQVQVGSGGSTVYVDVCTWPTQPSNSNCGQNN